MAVLLYSLVATQLLVATRGSYSWLQPIFQSLHMKNMRRKKEIGYIFIAPDCSRCSRRRAPGSPRSRHPWGGRGAPARGRRATWMPGVSSYDNVWLGFRQLPTWNYKISWTSQRIVNKMTPWRGFRPGSNRRPWVAHETIPSLCQLNRYYGSLLMWHSLSGHILSH